jgi:hypothetical protein
MEYRIVEAILVKLHEVAPEDLGAFRARLRVLRDMGIPDMPRVGKGARVEFADVQVEEMHLALTMSEFGLTPARVVQVIGFLRVTPTWLHRKPHADAWLVVSLRANAGKLSTSDDALIRMGIISTATLVEDLAVIPGQRLTTWNAVLSLTAFDRDADLIRSQMAE